VAGDASSLREQLALKRKIELEISNVERERAREEMVPVIGALMFCGFLMAMGMVSWVVM
jgi:hypothetical protein